MLGMVLAVRARAVLLIGVAAAACGVGAVASVPAASATSCPQATALNNADSSSSSTVWEWKGTASGSYVSGTVTGAPPNNPPNPDETVSIDHSATGLVFPEMDGGEGQGPSGQPAWYGTETSGNVSVNDTSSGGPDAGSSSQSANGAVSSGDEAQTNPAELLFDTSACTYQLIFSYGITISSSSDPGSAAPAPPESDVLDEVVTPSEPIPSDLVLTGSASPQIDITQQYNAGNAPVGAYELEEDSFGVNNWLGTLQYANDGNTTPVGTGTASWNFTPIYFPASNSNPTPNNPTPTSTVKCTVPALKGKSESKAKKAITKAHCAVGKIKHKRSHKVKKGHVISSSPGAGTKHAAGTKVKLVLSSG
jgi:hypothetical protein